MAPIVKLMSSTGFIYEKNNFMPYVEKAGTAADFHQMMDFIKRCKLSKAMLTPTPLYHEVIEEVWTSAERKG